MTTYQVTHLSNKSVHDRPYLLLNPYFQSKPSTNSNGKSKASPAAEEFHKQLPHYGETPLHSLDSLAKALGYAHVFLKDEGTRFGLPSFKILGASWAIYRALCQRLSLPDDPSRTTLQDLKAAIAANNKDSSSPVRLVTCSEGNWGRACARMAKYLGLPCMLHVPAYMNEYTQGLIRSEGASVQVVTSGPGGGSYDDAIEATVVASREPGAILALDTSWEGYEEIPGWVTEGYRTMLVETDRQVAAALSESQIDGGGGGVVDVAFCSVGVGSWAHAVAEHYCRDPQRGGKSVKFFITEPDTAASTKESLHEGELTAIETGDTIMCGMNCGTPSTIAWEVLRENVYGAVAVTDYESHAEVQALKAVGINAGPCGAANVAALKTATRGHEGQMGLLGSKEERARKVVVLFSTEGGREYEAPK